MATRLHQTLITLLISLSLFTSTAHAATIAVTPNAPDVIGANGSCSLREAIQNVNDGADTFAECAKTGAIYGTADTINIPAGTYTNAIAGALENLNATGDLDISKSVTIAGAGAGTTIVDGGALDRVFHITAGGLTVTFRQLTARNGLVGDNGSAGGGIYSSGVGGTLVIDRCAITGNQINDTTGANQLGGGIVHDGTLTITDSTISGNSIIDNGGAEYGVAIICTNCLGSMTNTTVSGNSSANGQNIVSLSGPGAYTLSNVTITANTFGVAAFYAAIRNAGGGIVITLTNSIVANQTVGVNCSGPITSGGHNLDSDNTCSLVGVGDIPGSAAANLGALASNGGATQTHALLAGSAALNAGDCNGGAVTADQRGTARPQGAACDIGAYEAKWPTVNVTVNGTGSVADDTSLAGFAIDCGATCNDTVLEGDSVTLTATPGAGQSFTGWSGACAGTGNCTLNNITADTSVTATFAPTPTPTPTPIPASPDLGTSVTSVSFGSVTVGGSGSGTATIRNSGNGSIAVTGVGAPSSPFSVVNDGCSGQALRASGGSCGIDFGFNPTTAGTFSETITVSTNYGPLTITLSGSGVSSGGGTVLTAPVLLTPSDGAILPAGSVTFQWTPGAGDDELLICDNADFEGCVATTARATIPAGLIVVGLLIPFGLRSRAGRSALLALLIVAGGITACGSSSDTSDAASTETRTLTGGTYYWKVVTTSGSATGESEVRSLVIE